MRSLMWISSPWFSTFLLNQVTHAYLLCSFNGTSIHKNFHDHSTAIECILVSVQNAATNCMFFWHDNEATFIQATFSFEFFRLSRCGEKKMYSRIPRGEDVLPFYYCRQSKYRYPDHKEGTWAQQPFFPSPDFRYRHYSEVCGLVLNFYFFCSCRDSRKSEHDKNLWAVHE